MMKDAEDIIINISSLISLNISQYFLLLSYYYLKDIKYERRFTVIIKANN